MHPNVPIRMRTQTYVQVPLRAIYLFAGTVFAGTAREVLNMMEVLKYVQLVCPLCQGVC